MRANFCSLIILFKSDWSSCSDQKQIRVAFITAPMGHYFAALPFGMGFHGFALFDGANDVESHQTYQKMVSFSVEIQKELSQDFFQVFGRHFCRG